LAGKGRLSGTKISTKNMGIHGLSKLLGDIAPSGMKENEIKNYFGEYVSDVICSTLN